MVNLWFDRFRGRVDGANPLLGMAVGGLVAHPAAVRRLALTQCRGMALCLCRTLGVAVVVAIMVPVGTGACIATGPANCPVDAISGGPDPGAYRRTPAPG